VHTIADEEENICCLSLCGGVSDNPVSHGLASAIILQFGRVFSWLMVKQEVSWCCLLLTAQAYLFQRELRNKKIIDVI
jgi:hypothetical protein